MRLNISANDSDLGDQTGIKPAQKRGGLLSLDGKMVVKTHNRARF